MPRTIVKDVRELLEISQDATESYRKDGVKMTAQERKQEIERLEKQMREAARMMEYEYAAVLRDQIIELRGIDQGKTPSAASKPKAKRSDARRHRS